jgi:transcriptional regulator with XRE-family HTH domain
MKDLRAMRELAGITQFSLSRRSGVSRMRLSLAECGETELSAEEREKITKVLLAAIQLKRTRIGNVLANAGSEQSRVKT